MATDSRTLLREIVAACNEMFYVRARVNPEISATRLACSTQEPTRARRRRVRCRR